MAKFSAIVVAAAALLLGVSAQPQPCPEITHDHLLCGSELVDKFNCASAGQLEVLAGGQGVWRTNVYHVNDIGTPDQYIADCKANGCINFDPSHVDAHCR